MHCSYNLKDADSLKTPARHRLNKEYALIHGQETLKGEIPTVHPSYIRFSNLEIFYSICNYVEKKRKCQIRVTFAKRKVMQPNFLLHYNCYVLLNN